MQGIVAKPTRDGVDKDANWKGPTEWIAAVFRFRRCPIFVTEILAVQGDEVVFSKLCCWTKDTILAPSPRPCQIHLDAPDPAEFLPPTERIVWMWRKKSAIGVEKPSYELVEMPKIEAQRELFTLSTRLRAVVIRGVSGCRAKVSWEEIMKQFIKE